MLIFECTYFGVMTAETDQKAPCMHTLQVHQVRTRNLGRQVQ